MEVRYGLSPEERAGLGMTDQELDKSVENSFRTARVLLSEVRKDFVESASDAATMTFGPEQEQ